jgi:Coenzyme PQQ synthesis protein D (PqqD)
MTTWFSRHPDLRLTALEGEGVALHLGARRYFTVSETGLDILEALTVPRTFDALVTTLTERYAVDAAHAAASVRGFLDRCLEAGLVRTEERAE